MAPQTPYTDDLAGRDPITAIRESLARLRSLTAAWRPHDFERSYAPGKWSARQVLAHLAQSELAFGTRVRMALTSPNYTAQPFDQDRWMAREAAMSAREAVDALLGLAAINLSLFASLSPADRATTLSHPEYGVLTVDWVIHQSAGHQIHHLKQLESIASA